MNTTPFVPLSLLAVLAIGAGATRLQAQEAEKPVMYAVVQVDDEYRVIKADEVAALKDSLKQEYKNAIAAHKEAVKEAKANKAEAPEAPKAKKLKVIKPKLEEAAANELVEKLKSEGGKPAKEGKGKPEAKRKPTKEKPKKGSGGK